MYTGEIRDEHGDVESACTRETTHGIKIWFFDHNIKFSDVTMRQFPDGNEIARYTFRHAPSDSQFKE